MLEAPLLGSSDLSTSSEEEEDSEWTSGDEEAPLSHHAEPPPPPPPPPTDELEDGGVLSPTMSECGVEPMQSAHSRCDVGPNPDALRTFSQSSRGGLDRSVVCALRFSHGVC